MTDTLDDLAHDHADLNRRVLELGAQLRALQRAGAGPAGLEATLSELRERLFLHFAREEEGLFPLGSQFALVAPALVPSYVDARSPQECCVRRPSA